MLMDDIQSHVSKLISEKKYNEVIFLLNSNLNNLQRSWCHNILGFCFFEVQNIPKAIENFNLAIYYDNKDPKPYFNLALLYSSKNLEINLANNFYLQAIKLDNTNIDYKISYANYLSKLNNSGAVRYYYEAIELKPNLVKAYIGLSEYYNNKENFKESINICQKYFLKYDKDPFLLNNLSAALIRLGMFEEATKELKSALILNQNIDATHLNLGICYYQIGDFKNSLSFFSNAIKINSSNEINLIFYGRALSKLKNPTKSLNWFRKAYKIKKNPLILFEMAYVFSDFKRINCALRLFQKAIKLKPESSQHISDYIGLLRYKDNLIEDEYLIEAKKLIRKFKVNSNVTDQLNFKKKVSKKLVVGFVSGDLRDHPVSRFIIDTLDHLKKNFTLIAYYNNVVNDKFSSEMMKKFDSWKNIYGINDVSASKLIKSDKVDILFDLSGHTSKNRFLIFKLRSAPIQISWIGYLASTCLDEMDYIIADKYTVPNKHFKNFTEKVIQLPNIWNTYRYEDAIEKNNTSPCIKNGYLTLGCFNNPGKINSRTIKLFSDLLKSNKNFKIIFKYKNIDNPFIKNKIISIFKKNLAPIENIIFEQGSSRNDFLKTYNKIDISIDPVNYNGGSTSFESVMMGVPVMSLIGDSFISRCGYSINMNLKLNKMIAVDNHDFVKKINFFYDNKLELDSIRQMLIAKGKFSPLYNHNKLSKNLANALNDLFKNNY
jgi:protein O-GlcNAc transferase